MERQRVQEQEIQALRLIEQEVIHRVSILTSKLTTVLTVLQALDGGPARRDPVRSLTASLRKILDNEPLISGLTLVDGQGRSWGLGRFGKDGWVTVTPHPGDRFFQSLRFAAADAGTSTSTAQIISLPRLVSPWFQVMASKDGQILWAPPFTSTVIAEPVVSAAIRSSHGRAKAYAAHVRLADLQILSARGQQLAQGQALLMDRRGRVVARSRTHPDDEIGGLLGALSDLQLDPFSTMLDQWLKAGKPLRTPFRFDSIASARSHIGWVSTVWLGGLELTLMVEIPTAECALSCFLQRLPSLLLPGRPTGVSS